MRIEKQLGIVLVLVGAGVACGDTSTGSLLLGSGASPSPGASASGTAGASSGAGATGSGATGTGSGGTGTGTGTGSGSSSGGTTTTTLPDGGTAIVGDGGAGPRALFEALLPTFETTCGGPCHVQGLTNAPAYLGGADPYATIKTYPGMIAPVAAQSILLTKGQHEGPAIADPLKTMVTNWLTAEAAALAANGPAETSAITVASGANTVDLSTLGVKGASLTFSAAVSGSILTLSAVTLVAPAASGVAVSYPIFYVNGAGGAQTENDDMSNVDQTIGAGTSAPLGTVLLILSGWAATDTLHVAFTKHAAATVADAGATGGCKSVASFTTNAVPAIQNNTCLNCHNTGGSGNASLDLSGLAANPVNDTAACAQALSRINTTTPAQSDIILAPTGGVANHPFKGASAAYTTMMETWISAEK